MADFASTHWSVVLAAGAGGAARSPAARAALSSLYQSYWRPLYGFVRSQGHAPEDARDLTQGFFADLLARDSLKEVSPERGRFRSFLLAALRHFLENARDRERARKRGGDAQHLPLEPLDLDEGERGLAALLATGETPERIYQRRWATALLDAAMARLVAEQRSDEQRRRFEQLRPLLAGDVDRGAHAEAAAALGMTSGAVAVALHRLRQRYRELVRAEIARTVAEPTDVDDEIRQLFGALSA